LTDIVDMLTENLWSICELTDI